MNGNPEIISSPNTDTPIPVDARIRTIDEAVNELAKATVNAI